MSWLVETLVATTVLMVLVLLVRERVAAIFGARAAYLLWLLPALRMVLPPLPESVGPAPIAQLPALVDIDALALLAAMPPVESTLPWATILISAWLGGAALLLVQQFVAYHRFVSGALGDAIELPEFDNGAIEVCASRAVQGPFAAGLLTPKVVLPHDWRSRYSKQELRLALRHETIHHTRGDLPINFIALAMLALHWFNPLAWLSWRAFRADQEAACDAAVLDGASAQERHSYGLALVKSACPRTPIAACSLNPRDQLKRRLRMMRSRERRASGRALAVAMVAGGLALTASGGIAAETTKEWKDEVHAQVIAPVVEAVADVRSTPPVAAVPPVAPVVRIEAVAAPALVPAVPVPPPVRPVDTLVVAPPHPVPTVAPVPHISHIGPGIVVARVKLKRGFPFEPGKCPDRLERHEGPHGTVRCMPDIDHEALAEALAEARIERIGSQIEALTEARESLRQITGVERKHIAGALAGIDARLLALKVQQRLGNTH